MILQLTPSTKYLGDVSARQIVEITIRPDSLVIWINVDGVCMARIMSNGMVPIIVEDRRKPDWNEIVP